VFSSPAIGSDGTVYVGSNDKKLYAINGKSGVKLWEFETGDFVWSSPAIGSDGTVYIGGECVYALNGKTGDKKWGYGTGSGTRVQTIPAFKDAFTLYTNDQPIFLSAINSSDGARKFWVPHEQLVVTYKRPAFTSTQQGKKMSWGWGPNNQLPDNSHAFRNVPDIGIYREKPETTILILFDSPDFEYEWEYQGTKYPVYVYKSTIADNPVGCWIIQPNPPGSSSISSDIVRRPDGSRYEVKGISYQHVSFIMRTDNQGNRVVSRVLPGKYVGHLFQGPSANQTVLESAFRAKLKKPRPNVLTQEDLDRGIAGSLILGRLKEARSDLEDHNIKFLATFPRLTKVHFLVGPLNQSDRTRMGGRGLERWITEADKKCIAKVRASLPRTVKIYINFNGYFAGNMTVNGKMLRSAFPGCEYHSVLPK
jgi:hypothetical protein